ncbi:hypothetical protein AWB69_08457 [Caballeronia udeis]|uniref:Uncharacterized protein n=1 Tax=Caballeronia udeis TaxID=1232866 RepID=A0A158JQX8_9BURK|nr:hypothetical protein AWB69_08457 [Caballeronia udeis]
MRPEYCEAMEIDGAGWRAMTDFRGSVGMMDGQDSDLQI